VTEVPAWDAESLRTKAALYFERAFEAEDEEDVELFALWTHLGLELLMRAAVARINPALLAIGNDPSSMLYGLGLDPKGDPLKLTSASTAIVIGLCEQLVDGFESGEAGVCHEARRRRNAELHTATAAMGGLAAGWRGRIFATCRVLAKHLGATLEDLFGNEAAELAERLIAEDAESVRKETRSAINAANKRAAKLSGEERAKREEKARHELLERRGPFGFRKAGANKPRILRQVSCPGCETTVALRGNVVRSGAPRIKDGELIQTDIALPSLLECPVCELKLEGPAQLTDAGLGDLVHLREYPDPVETFSVELSDYRDDFVQMLAEDDAYQDE